VALSASLALDVTRYQQGLKTATVELQTFERAGRTVSRDLKRLLEDFSGQRAAAEAARMAEAVERVGGASKLTQSEQRRVNAAVQEAIDKYRALGQEAPPHLLKLADATKQIEAPTGRVAAMLAGGVAGAVAAVGTAAIDAAGALARMAVDGIGQVVERGSRVATLRGGFERLSGGVEGADRTLRAVRESTAGLIRDFDVMAATNKALLLGLNTSSDEMADLAQTSTVLGRAMDQDATTSLDDLITALGRSSPMILDNLGLTVRVGEANETYARSVGKSVEQLTDAEKKTAFYNAAMAAARDKVAELGGVNLTLADQVSRLATTLGNLADRFSAAAASAPELRGAFAALNQLLEAMTTEGDEATSTIGRLWNAWERFISAGQSIPMLGTLRALADEAIVHERAMSGTAAASKGAIDAWASGLQPATAMTAGLAIFNDYLDDHETALKAAAAAQERYNDTVKRASGREAVEGGREIVRVLGDIGGPLRALPSELEGMARGLEAAAAGARALGQTRAAREFELLAKSLTPAQMLQQRYNVTIGEFVTINRSHADAVRQQIEGYNETRDAIAFGILPQIGKLHTAWVELRPAVRSSLEGSTSDVEAWGAALADAFGRIPDILQDAFTGGGGTSGAVKGLASLFGEATIGKLAKGWFEGASGLLGVLGPGIGQALGAAVPFLVDGIGRLFGGRPAHEDIRRRVSAWAGPISEGLAQAIADVAKSDFGGNRQAAEIFSLDRILGETGGLDVANLETMTGKLRDVFVMIETGAFTAAQGQDALNRSFGEFAAFWEAQGGLVSDQFLEILELNRRFGTESAAVSSYVRGQLSGASDGLLSWLETGRRAYGQLEADERRLAELQAQAARGGVEDRERLNQEIERVSASIRNQQGIIAATGITSQASAEAAGASVAAVFAEIQASGGTAREAIAAVGPATEALAAQLEAAGLSGGAAFDTVREYARLAADEVAGPAIEAIDGIGRTLRGLHNAGVPVDAMFAGLAAQVGQTYRSLVEQGRGGPAALALIAPTLQTIWELQQRGQEVTDEATLALLAEAEAAGLVGDEHRSAADRAAQAQERQLEVLEAIARALGADLPSAADEATAAAERLNRELRNVPSDVTTRFHYENDPRVGQPGESGPPVEDPGNAIGTMGRYGQWFHNFGGGTRTTLHGLEAVVRPDQAPAFAAAVGAQGRAQIVVVPVVSSTSPEAAARLVAKRLPRWMAGNVEGMRSAFQEVFNLGG
jgi:hypothetical protein